MTLKTVKLICFLIATTIATYAQNPALNTVIQDSAYSSLGAACAASASTGKTLQIVKGGLTQTTNCAAPMVEFPLAGVAIRPGAGQTVTFTGPITAGDQQLFDISAGGSVLFNSPTLTSVNVMWFGAVPGSATDSGTAIQAAYKAAALNSTNGGGTSPVAAGVTWPSQMPFYTSRQIFAGDDTWTGSATSSTINPQCYSGAIQCPMAAFTRGAGRWTTSNVPGTNLTALPSMTRAQFVFSAPGLFERTIENFGISGADVAACFNGSFLLASRGTANINTYHNLAFTRCANSSVSPFYEVYLDDNNDSAVDNIFIVPSSVDATTKANPLALHFQADGGSLGSTSNVKVYGNGLVYFGAQNAGLSDSYLSGGIMLDSAGISYVFTDVQIEFNPVSRHAVDVDPAAFAGPYGVVFNGGYLIPSGFLGGTGCIFNGTYINGVKVQGTFFGPTAGGTTFCTIKTPVGGPLPLFEFANLAMNPPPEVNSGVRVKLHNVYNNAAGYIVTDEDNSQIYSFDPSKPAITHYGGTPAGGVPGTVDLEQWYSYNGSQKGVSVDNNGVLNALSSVIVPLFDIGSNTTLTYQSFILCDATSGSFTITLPTLATGIYGRYFTVVKADGTANACTVASNGSTIDIIGQPADARVYYASGVGYLKVSGPTIPPHSCTNQTPGTLWNNAGVAAFCP
jgi:hypothetical protein